MIFLLLLVLPLSLSLYLVKQERAEGAMQLPKTSYISSFDELNYIITSEILFEAKNNSLPEISHQLSEANQQHERSGGSSLLCSRSVNSSLLSNLPFMV